jgi:hypothetical protein
MATLVLSKDERVEDLFVWSDDERDFVINVQKLNLVLSREGYDHKILKGPFKKSKKIQLQ